MEKRLLALLLAAVLVCSFALAGCGKSEEKPAEEPQQEEQQEEEPQEEEQEMPGAKYGYGGDDPVEAAVYQYMAEEVTKNFDKAEVSIPTVNIINVDYTNEEDVVVCGDFQVDNYKVDGDTLKTVSGGSFPGVMHLAKDGEAYKVTSMDVVEDGGGFEESAKKLFGEHYEDFMKVYSDDKARDELRKITVSDYVNLNGLDITKYQDEGQDPVELYK